MKLNDSALVAIMVVSLSAFATIGVIFQPNSNAELKKTQYELIETQRETIHRLKDDLNTMVHYPESQKAQSIIHRVRLNAAIDEALIIVDEAENSTE